MELTVSVVKLQSMVAKAMKCVSNNKMLPLTGMLSIRVNDGTLVLQTTDGLNYLYVRDYFDADDFEVVVLADMFSKLISKLSCDTVTLLVDNGILTVKGNGEYKIELPLAEDGGMIKFPDPAETFNCADTFTMPTLVVDLMLNTAKSSLSTTVDIPCYTGYYVADKIVTTNVQELCGINIAVTSHPCLIAASTVDLLGLMITKEIEVSFSADNSFAVQFESETCAVYSSLMDSISDFQIDIISQLLDDDFPSVCKVSKYEFSHLLDRLVLFVGPYDNNCVYLTFTNEGIIVNSLQTSGVELVEYVGSLNHKDFKCCIDIEMLLSQIKAYPSDIIELHYGKDNAIKLVDGNVTQIISLQDDIDA